jgi:hypothetical protein
MAFVVVVDLVATVAFHRMEVDLEAPCCTVLVPPAVVADDTDDEVRGNNDSEVEDMDTTWCVAVNIVVVSELVVVGVAGAGNIADLAEDILALCYDHDHTAVAAVVVTVNEMTLAAYSYCLLLLLEMMMIL